MKTEDGRIICDSCGRGIPPEEMRFQSPLSICHYYGYGSVNDLCKINTDFCMRCADKFLPILIDFCGHSGENILKEYHLANEIEWGKLSRDDIRLLFDSDTADADD